MKVLWVGATGVIGSQCVPLLQEKFELSLAAFGGGEINGHKVEHLDITDWDRTEEFVRETAPDALVNCAISPHREADFETVEGCWAYDLGCVEVNARGALHLFEAAWRARVPRVLYISSMTAVLGKPFYDFVERDACDRPNSIYAASKVFGEGAARTFAFRRDENSQFAMNALCLRLGQPFPSLTAFDEQWQLLPREHGMMVHIEDVAQSVECALNSDRKFDIYPIVSHSDSPRVDTSKCQEIGYRARWTFTPRGAARREAENGVR